MFMPAEEQEEFQRILQNAIEDLVNARPSEPIKYLAQSLYQSLPVAEQNDQEFPEFAASRNHPYNVRVGDSTPNPNVQYPEGFVPSRRRNFHLASVCGESISEEELAWRPPTFDKDLETLTRLKEMLTKNILFSHLSEENIATVADALELIEVPAGDTVIKQHDTGNACYFVEEGSLKCDVEGRGHVCNYGKEDSFGEVALMYGNIRGATIAAATDSKLWKLDRMTYKKIVLNFMLPKRSKFVEFLTRVSIFNTLPETIMNELAKHSHHLVYEPGYLIYSASHADRYLYLIEKGVAVIKYKDKDVQRLGPFEFFGDRSIFGEVTEADRAEAETECCIYRFPEPIIDSILDLIKDELREQSSLKLL